MNYRQRRSKDCQELFLNFHPDFSGCRDIAYANKVLELARDGYFSHEIALLTEKTPKAIQKFFRRYNFPSLHNFAVPLREERHGWKGGIKIVKGYYYSRCPGHPYASKHGNYVAVHRLVYEQYLGRYLTPKEVVHHKDDNPANNDISNLEMFESNGAHLHETLKGKCPDWTEEGKAAIREALVQRWEDYRQSKDS